MALFEILNRVSRASRATSTAASPPRLLEATFPPSSIALSSTSSVSEIILPCSSSNSIGFKVFFLKFRFVYASGVPATIRAESLYECSRIDGSNSDCPPSRKNLSGEVISSTKSFPSPRKCFGQGRCDHARFESRRTVIGAQSAHFFRVDCELYLFAGLRWRTEIHNDEIAVSLI